MDLPQGIKVVLVLGLGETRGLRLNASPTRVPITIPIPISRV